MPEPIVMKRLRPYFGRISVLESPVDEEQRDSGLVVPIELEEGTSRGIIINIDHIDDDASEEYIKERLREGSVVYYQGGVKISDLTFITSNQIIAYEEDE